LFCANGQQWAINYTCDVNTLRLKTGRSAYKISFRDFSFRLVPSGITCSLSILHIFKYFHDESRQESTMRTPGINFESRYIFSVSKTRREKLFRMSHSIAISSELETHVDFRVRISIFEKRTSTINPSRCAELKASKLKVSLKPQNLRQYPCFVRTSIYIGNRIGTFRVIS